MNLLSILNQFKGLKRDDPSTWPLAPRLTALMSLFLGVLAAGYFIDTKPQLDSLDEGIKKESLLKQEYLEKYRLAVNLEKYKAQLAQTDVAFGELLKQLPDRSKMESLITDINQAGVSRGLMFDLFKPEPNENRKEFYAELPIALKLQGNYHQMGLFAADIGKLSRIVTLNNINVTVSKDGKLQMETTAKTFRYLDDEEVAAQRKIDADKKAKSKGKPAAASK